MATPQFNVKSTYDYVGNVLTQTYPSGHSVNYAYDIAGRMNSYTGNLGDGVSRTYSTGVSYSEFGGLQQERIRSATIRRESFSLRRSTEVRSTASTLAWVMTHFCAATACRQREVRRPT